MKNVIATLTVAALAAWAAPASAGVVFTDPGGTLSTAAPSFVTGPVDLTGIYGAILSFDTDGNGGIDPCGGENEDCFSVSVSVDSGATFIELLEDVSVPGSPKSWTTEIGIDDDLIDLTFMATFSSSNESIDVSNIKVSTYIVPEPTNLALFSFGLAGLGYVRRRRST